MTSVLRFLVLIGVLLLVGCAGNRPPTASGHQPKLETIQHDWQTTYLYR